MSNRKIHGCIDKGLYFKSRKEAEQFIESMSEISDTYGFIFYADVLDYFGEDCEINHDHYGWLDVRKWFVHHVGYLTPYIDHPYRVQLNRPVYYSDDTPSLYPETHFIFPGRSGGKVLFTKAWMNAMYGTPMYSIKNVIFNDPATIVFWSDGTKTVVKAQDGEVFDPEKGLAMAISKKALGNNREYYHTFLRWLKKYQPKKYICMYCGTDTTNPAWDHVCNGCVDAFEECQENYKKYNKKYNPVQAAYDLLVKIRDTDKNVCVDEVIGYLGEALED